MELYTTLTCTAEGPVASALHEAFEGMSNGELGAKLQDRLDPLGARVADKLAMLLDEDLLDLLVEDYARTGDRFELNIMTGGSGEDSVAAFMELLHLCGATDIRARVEGDDYARLLWLENGTVMEESIDLENE